MTAPATWRRNAQAQFRAWQEGLTPATFSDLVQRAPAALAAAGKRLGSQGAGRVRLLWHVLRSESVPRSVKVLAAAALLYWLNPFDAIPDFLAGLGYADDLAVLATAVGAIMRTLRETGLIQGLGVALDGMRRAAVPA